MDHTSHTDDEWTALADEGTTSSRKWLIALVVLIAVIAVSTVMWLRQDGTPAATSQTPAESIDRAGLGLLEDPFPEQALTAFATQTKLNSVSRILLTPNQIQATGKATDGTWHDAVFASDRAIDLGEALIAPSDEDAFDIADIDGRALTATIASVATEAAATNGTITQVTVQRDTAGSDRPVVIEVYWNDVQGLHVTRTDTTGNQLAS